MGTRRSFGFAVSIPMFFFAFVALAAEPVKPIPAQVKVATFQDEVAMLASVAA